MRIRSRTGVERCFAAAEVDEVVVLDVLPDELPPQAASSSVKPAAASMAVIALTLLCSPVIFAPPLRVGSRLSPS
jgi:hypothetical protein